MDKSKLFEKYYFRVAKEGIIKALIWGFILGFATSIIPAIIGIVWNFSGVWICLAVVLGVTAITTPLFYFWIFKPTAKQIAERIDRLGYDERFITMLELENDESYVAMCQREDAKSKLVSNKRPIKLSFAMFIVPIIMVSVFCISSVLITTASALSVTPKMAWTEPAPRPETKNGTISVKYYSMGLVKVPMDDNTTLNLLFEGVGGHIQGYADQLVQIEYLIDDEGEYRRDSAGRRTFVGQDASTVKAVVNDGYLFVQWSDGLSMLERTDVKLAPEWTKNTNGDYKLNHGWTYDKEKDEYTFSVYAIFQEDPSVAIPLPFTIQSTQDKKPDKQPDNWFVRFMKLVKSTIRGVFAKSLPGAKSDNTISTFDSLEPPPPPPPQEPPPPPPPIDGISYIYTMFDETIFYGIYFNQYLEEIMKTLSESGYDADTIKMVEDYFRMLDRGFEDQQ